MFGNWIANVLYSLPLTCISVVHNLQGAICVLLKRLNDWAVKFAQSQPDTLSSSEEEETCVSDAKHQT